MRFKIGSAIALGLTLVVHLPASLAQVAEGPPVPPANALTNVTRALRDDPRLQERYREMQFQELKDIYRDFVKEERLSAEQERNFYQLLVDQNLEYFIEDDKFMQDLAQKPDPAATPTATREAVLKEKLHLLLGDKTAARLEEYDKNGTERLILAQYRHELRLADIALSEETAKSLFQIVCEEKARMPALAFDARGNASNNDIRKALEGDNAEKYYEAEADLNRRILARAGAALNDEQYQALAKFLARHLAAEKAGIEAMRRTLQESQADQPNPDGE